MKRRICFFIMIVMMLCLSGCGKKKLDVAMDLDVKFSGISGKGTAEVVFANSSMTYGFITDLAENTEILNDIAKGWETLNNLGSAVRYRVEPKENLSNGDVVTVYIDVNEKTLAENGYSAKSQIKQFTVKGLTDLRNIDMFSNFEISFSGMEMEGKADYSKRQEIDGVSIRYRIIEEGPYKNGQEITVQAYVEADSSFTSERKYTVSGLEAKIEIEAFQNFEISFSGISPSCKADYTTKETIGDVTVRYSLDNSRTLKAGQEVTVKATISSGNNKYFLKYDTKTFIVTGVDKYLEDYSELRPETLENLFAEGNAVIEEKKTNLWDYSQYHCQGFELVGYEFWNQTEINGFLTYNAICLYYKLDVERAGEKYDIYYYIMFTDMMEKPDGTQICNYKYPTTGSTPLYGDELLNYQTLESRTVEAAARYGSYYRIVYIPQ